ncbi:PIN domain-containing protein [Collinsella tanakaei]|nr:PIN domain-containing protein [Collinsella tanakaei]
MKYIYWDSNCFLAYLKGEEHGRDAIMGVLQAVERGEAKLVTSAFTMVEVVKVKAKNANGPYYIDGSRQEDLEKCFSPENGVILVNVDRLTATMAREAVWNYHADPKDAIHIGSALQFMETVLEDDDEFVFQTFDKKLLNRVADFNGMVFEEPNVQNYPYQMKAEFE